MGSIADIVDRIVDLTLDKRALEETVKDLQDQLYDARRRADLLSESLIERDREVARLGAESAYVLELAQALRNLDRAYDWKKLDGLDLIPAIKQYREDTSVGLKIAKLTIEAAYLRGLVTLKQIPLAINTLLEQKENAR